MDRKNLFTDARDAITYSAAHDEIAYCDDTIDNRTLLSVSADDYAENGEVTEYWGTDEFTDDSPFRVHIWHSDRD